MSKFETDAFSDTIATDTFRQSPGFNMNTGTREQAQEYLKWLYEFEKRPLKPWVKQDKEKGYKHVRATIENYPILTYESYKHMFSFYSSQKLADMYDVDIMVIEALRTQLEREILFGEEPQPVEIKHRCHSITSLVDEIEQFKNNN